MAEIDYLVCPICVAEGTNVVYGDGDYKKIEDIRVGDILRGSIVTRTHVKRHEGMVVRVKPMYFDSVVFTPEHEVLVREGESVGKNGRRILTNRIMWKKVIDLHPARQRQKKHDYLMVPKSEKEGETYIDMWGYVKNTGKSSRRTKSLYLSKTKVTEEFAEFCGWYCAEGFVSKEEVNFSLGSHEKENIARICELAIKLGFCSKTRVKQNSKYKSVSVVVVSSRILSRMLVANFGRGAENKRIPQFIVNARLSVVKSFIDAYIKGDGHVHGKVTSVTSVSERMIRQLQLLLLRLGILSTLMFRKGGHGRILGRDVSLRPAFILAFFDREWKCARFFEDDNYFYVPVRSVTVEQYSGNVYDLETSFGVFFVPFVVHNCAFNRPVRKLVDKLGGPLPVFGVDLETRRIIQTREGGGRGVGFSFVSGLTIREMVFSGDEEHIRLLRELSKTCRDTAEYIDEVLK